MGRLPEAREWLNQAFQMAAKTGILKVVKLRALDDSDLEPL